jgi:hypothetical protein
VVEKPVGELDRGGVIRCLLAHGGWQPQLHLGGDATDRTAYKLAPNQQLDFHAAAGLSEAAPKFYVGLGYCYLFLMH